MNERADVIYRPMALNFLFLLPTIVNFMCHIAPCGCAIKQILWYCSPLITDCMHVECVCVAVYTKQVG